MAHILKIIIAGFAFWLMLIMTLDLVNIVDITVDAPFLLDLIKVLPNTINLIADAKASQYPVIADIVHDTPWATVKVVILP